MTRIRFTLAAFSLLVVAGIATAAKPAKDVYPFTVPADKAFARLASLDGAAKPTFVATNDLSFADQCLVASGITDAEKRTTFLAKLAEIEKAARKAVADAKSQREKAERLLKFLHEGPMAAGYEASQTDLYAIIETGKFNCVSSAAMYNVIGRRLGLELRAVEIPEHVFSVLCDGEKRIDIETTNARGFDPDAKGEIGKERHAGHRREVGDAGLASIIAYNHGVALSKEKRYYDATLANCRALALDPTNPGAAKNAIADLVNWPNEMIKNGEYERALAVLAVGLQLAPTESGLKHNHKVAWAEYAESRMKAGKVDEAVAILRRAAKAGTGEDFETRQAYLFIGPAQDLMDVSKWDEALVLIDRGLKAVDPKAQKKLREVRVGLFLQWSHAEATNKAFEKSLAVLKRAAAEERDGRIKNNTLALYDSWANTHIQRGEWKEAIKVYEQGLKQLPGDSHLTNNLAYCREQMKK